MACEITITGVVGIGVFGDLVSSIIVTGTATDCPGGEVIVSVTCSPPTTVEVTATVELDGTWNAVVEDTANTGCVCGHAFVTVIARCAGDPDCVSEPFEAELICEPPEECPDVIIAHSVSENPCVDGKREVTLIATNLGPGNPSAQWEVEPAVFLPLMLPMPVGTDTKIYDYVPGTHTAILHIENCPDESMDIDVPECPPEVGCPSIAFDVNRMNCKDDGTQPIQIKATLTGTPGDTISAELKEGATVLHSGTELEVLELDSGFIDYDSGTHTVTVEVTEPEDCPSASTTFEVECEPKGACCLPDGSCEELTETECEDRGGEYKGDGTSCADVECDGKGACCLPDGSCEEITESECLSRDGTFMGIGTACADVNQVGACCLPDDSCEEITRCECLGRGGTFKGAGVSCDDVECITNGGSCFDSFGAFLCCLLYGLLLILIAAFIAQVVAAFCPFPPNTTLILTALATLVAILIVLALLKLCSWSFCRILRALIWIFVWTAIACLIAFFFCLNPVLLIVAFGFGVLAGLLFLIKPSCGWPKLLRLP